MRLSSTTTTGAPRRPGGRLPALTALIAMVILARYPLNDERFQQIRNETEARKQVQLHDRDVLSEVHAPTPNP